MPKNSEDVKVLKLRPDAELPVYALDDDIAFDLRACEDVTISPLEQAEVKTGIAIEIPKGFVGLIRDRAGIVTEMAVHVVAGTYPAHYRGEIGIKMINFGDQPIKIERGMRISQMIIIPAKKFKIKEVKSLSKSLRDKQGMTGLH
jgi:dUTP pyrophosphatase